MTDRIINIFIVDRNSQMLSSLKQYLHQNYGGGIKVSMFHTSQNCLEKVDANTNFVIMGYFLVGENEKELSNAIKSINPNTKTILFSSTADIEILLDSFLVGLIHQPIKKVFRLKEIIPHLRRVVPERILRFKEDFSFSKYMAILLGTFILMGVIVFFVITVILRK